MQLLIQPLSLQRKLCSLGQKSVHCCRVSCLTLLLFAARYCCCCSAPAACFHSLCRSHCNRLCCSLFFLPSSFHFGVLFVSSNTKTHNENIILKCALFFPATKHSHTQTHKHARITLSCRDRQWQLPVNGIICAHKIHFCNVKNLARMHFPPWNILAQTALVGASARARVCVCVCLNACTFCLYVGMFLFAW